MTNPHSQTVPQDPNIEALTKINQRVVGNDTSNQLPVVTLPDGSKLQTGTVGAMLLNIKLYDRVCAGETVENITKDELEQMLLAPIPTLKKIGFFDIFPAEEWTGGNSAGRTFVGMKAKEMGY